MLKQFLRDEEGQTTVEYLLILAVLVVGISVLGKQLQNRLPQLIGKVFGGIEGQVDKLMGAANGR